jgi:hypothetical protein
LGHIAECTAGLNSYTHEAITRQGEPNFSVPLTTSKDSVPEQNKLKVQGEQVFNEVIRIASIRSSSRVAEVLNQLDLCEEGYEAVHL